MPKTLIIKTGASGDVIRTTVLLHIIPGEIYWLTTPYNVQLLPAWVNTIPFDGRDESLPTNFFSIEFDLVINLEEDATTARLACRLKKNQLIGTYWENNKIKYTSQSAPWFDMSLISVHGKRIADELKRNNRSPYQEILFHMLGKKFSGEKYLIRDYSFEPDTKPHKIGLEKHVGSRWPDKKWHGFNQLKEELTQDGYEAIIFHQRSSLFEYISEIYQCSFVVTGDTLAMHLALALEIPSLVIFTCTSPTEIYDYGILKKVVSPRLYEFFYKTTNDPEASTAISVEFVLEHIKKSWGVLKGVQF